LSDANRTDAISGLPALVAFGVLWVSFAYIMRNLTGPQRARSSELNVTPSSRASERVL
jgi:hypothetical protein